MAEGEVRIKDITNTVSSLSNNFYFVVDDGGITDKTYKFSAEEYLTMGQYLMGTLNNEIDTTTAMWSVSGSYVKGDVVINPPDARIYACNVANATVGTFVSSEWSALTLMGISGALFLNMSAEPMTFNQPISKGDVVYRVADASPYNPLYRGFYRAKADHPDGVASYVASDWDYFASLTALISDSNNRVMTLEDEMVTKAEQDGIYDLVSGNVKSNSYEVDTAPYLYRPSKDGSAVEEEIVGATVAWNQHFSLNNLPSDSALYSSNTYTANGVTFTKNNDGSITIQTVSGGATADTSVKIGSNYTLPFIQNHIHFIGKCKGGSSSTYNFSYAGSRYINDSDKVFDKQASGFNMWLNVKSGAIITTPIKVYPQIMDLEQTFGNAIASYVLSLEQATPGSGIAWLKSYGFLTKDYYSYDSGSLQSVNVTSRKIVGKNLFDNNWNHYTQPLNYRICPISLKKGVTYTISAEKIGETISGCVVGIVKDGDRYANFVGTDTIITAQGTISNYIPKTFVVDDTYVSPKLIIYCANEEAFNSIFENYNIQLEIGSTATSYEPYTTKTYTLNTGELRGLFKLDANNNLVADGDVRKTDALTRKYGVVDLGSLTWDSGTDGTGLYFYTNGLASSIKRPSTSTIAANVFCGKYEPSPASRVPDKSIAVATSGTVFIRDMAYPDSATFKTAMNGVYLVYELATPTTESATPFENPQLVFSGGTEEFIDGATRDVAIPVGQNSKYYLDIKGKVEQLYGIPEPPSTNGTYKLVCTVSSGVKTYSWVSN